jgi:hypothetical protein
MVRMSRAGIALALAFSCGLGACSSDTAPEPEPGFEQPGSFVAVDKGEGALTLYRMLDRLRLEDGVVILFVTVYDVQPPDWDAAREAAKDPDLPLRVAFEYEPRDTFTDNPQRVVWFRTLTDEEKERIP